MPVNFVTCGMRWLLPILMLITSCTQDVKLPDDKPVFDCYLDHCLDGRIETISGAAGRGIKEWYIVDTAYVQDKMLNIQLTDSGGCVDHCYELVWRGRMFYDNDSIINTSFAIYNCSQAKLCDELAKEHLEFDIQFLDELDTTGSIIIGIEPHSWDDSSFNLLYTH